MDDEYDDKPFRHAGRLHGKGASYKSARRRGWVLLEATYALSFLTALGLILFKMGMNITAPRQWTLQQTITDAYITYEKALAQRMSFSDLLDDDSPWPEYPNSSETVVEIGKLPGGVPVNATVIRTRVADDINMPDEGGSGDESTNPTEVQVWKFYSHISYTVADDPYVKSITVVRSQ